MQIKMRNNKFTHGASYAQRRFSKTGLKSVLCATDVLSVYTRLLSSISKSGHKLEEKVALKFKTKFEN